MSEHTHVEHLDHIDSTSTPLVIRNITVADIWTALGRGLDDFRAVPTHGVLFGLVYAVAGLILVRAAFDAALVPVMFPLVAGFALLGPFLALGLYELSRRREQGLPTRWWNLFDVRHHVSTLPILGLGGILAVLFVVWLATAATLYDTVISTELTGLGAFVQHMFTTAEGWTLIITGHALGAVFAFAAFTISVVSFPLLIDREIGVRGAISTSVRAVRANPVPMGLWALVITVAMMAGSAPLLLGLPVILPIIGHASWHVYRQVIRA